MGYFCSNAEVFTNKGRIPIKDIHIGDEILTDKGCFKKVINVSEKKYEGIVQKIHTKHYNDTLPMIAGSLYYSKPYKCKSNMVFCRPDCRKQVVHRRTLTSNCKKGYKEYCYNYSPLSQVEAGDIITFPIFKEIKDDQIVLKTPVSNGKEKRLPPEVIVTPEVMRFFGYYLSEGCLSKNRVILTFHAKEEVYHNDVMFLAEKCFGLKGKIRYPKNKDSVAITIDSKNLALFVESIFGHYAKYKNIPEWCLFLKEEYLIEFFKGWAYGDGGFKNDSYAITTINPDFCFKMGLILNKLKIQSYVTTFKTSSDNTAYRVTISGVQLNNLKDKTGITSPLKNRGLKINKFFYTDDNFVYYPVKFIEKEFYSGSIYKLNTEDDDSSYVVNNVLIR